MFPLCFALLALVLAVPAMAAPLPEPSKARVVEEAPGSARLCRTDKAYQDGRQIAFIHAAPNRLGLEFTIPGGRFQENRRYDLDLTLGETSPPRRVRAVALSDEKLFLDLGDNATFIAQMESSSLLSLSAGKKTIAFDLPLMPPLLESLRRCAQNAPLPEPTNTRPTPPIIRKKPSPPPIQEASFPDSLRAFLAKAGFKTIAPISLSSVPEAERAADFVWEMGDILGGVRVLPAPEGIALSDLVGAHLKGLKERCAGTFQASVQKERNAKAALLRSAEVTCTPPEGSPDPAVFVDLAFALSSEGTLTVITLESLEKHKDGVREAHTKIERLLIREAPPKVNKF